MNNSSILAISNYSCPSGFTCELRDLAPSCDRFEIWSSSVRVATLLKKWSVSVKKGWSVLWWQGVRLKELVVLCLRSWSVHYRSILQAHRIQTWPAWVSVANCTWQGCFCEIGYWQWLITVHVFGPSCCQWFCNGSDYQSTQWFDGWAGLKCSKALFTGYSGFVVIKLAIFRALG